jgi:hypothetical protein
MREDFKQRNIEWASTVKYKLRKSKLYQDVSDFSDFRRQQT